MTRESDWTFPGLEYKRPDVEQLKKTLADSAEAVKAARSFEEILSVMGTVSAGMDAFMTQYTIAEIRHTLDTTDVFYEDENIWLNEQYPTIMPMMVDYGCALADCRFRGDIEKKYGKQYFVRIDLQRKSFCEANIPLMQRESRLTDEYQKIMATCKIGFDGKELNLYGIRKYFEDEDRRVRRAAFQAYADFYHGHEERLEQIWDELISIRNEMGRNLGFENFIPLGYMQQGRTDYGVKEVESFRAQVLTELVPFCEELYRAQAKRLGIDKVMAYDEKRVFPDGNAIPRGDDDFMIDEARKMYHDMSKETGEFIDFMISHELLDLKNKPNKASTGYMTEFPTLKAPFVFSCFNGTIFDMQVLTHELGHAFAGYMAMKDQPISDYYSESTDIAEIHSMSMEQFAYPYAERFFGKDADKYRFQHLQEAITFVPYGVAVDEFQHICYANPELTPRERTMEWHKLEKTYMPWRAYMPDDFQERGGMWYFKLHIFLYPMYYINYTLTTMGAMEFKTRNAANHEEAWKDYLRLCSVGGSLSYLETLRHANLMIPFEEGAVAKACGYAKEVLRDAISRMEE